MKANVFFAPIRRGESLSSLARKSVRLLQKTGLEKIFKKDQLVAVKQHFGEHRDGHYVKPTVTAELVKWLTRRDKAYDTDQSTTTLDVSDLVAEIAVAAIDKHDLAGQRVRCERSTSIQVAASSITVLDGSFYGCGQRRRPRLVYRFVQISD